MKKICVVLCLCLVVLCGCGRDALKEPPTLSVVCGGEEYALPGGSGDWTYKDGFDRSISTVSCGAHVLDYFTPGDAIDAGENSAVTLRFAVKPDELEVRCWSDEHLGDTDSYESNFGIVPVNDGMITLPERGGWVYQVDATWLDHGSASYGFYVQRPDREPSIAPGELSPHAAAIPPTLTVCCNEEEYPAANNGYQWDSDNGDGTMSSVIACGMHVLDIDYEGEGLMIPRNSCESVTLRFSTTPLSIAVRCWSDEHLGDADSYEANVQSVSVTDGVITLPGDGGWVFEVRTTWARGSATYGFYIEETGIPW